MPTFLVVILILFLHYLYSTVLTLTPREFLILADAPDFPPIITTETGLSYIQVVHAS
jgi:hypothetical protein